MGNFAVGFLNPDLKKKKVFRWKDLRGDIIEVTAVSKDANSVPPGHDSWHRVGFVTVPEKIIQAACCTCHQPINVWEGTPIEDVLCDEHSQVMAEV